MKDKEVHWSLKKGNTKGFIAKIPSKKDNYTHYTSFMRDKKETFHTNG